VLGEDEYAETAVDALEFVRDRPGTRTNSGSRGGIRPETSKSTAISRTTRSLRAARSTAIRPLATSTTSRSRSSWLASSRPSFLGRRARHALLHPEKAASRSSRDPKNWATSRRPPRPAWRSRRCSHSTSLWIARDQRSSGRRRSRRRRLRGDRGHGPRPTRTPSRRTRSSTRRLVCRRPTSSRAHLEVTIAAEELRCVARRVRVAVLPPTDFFARRPPTKGRTRGVARDAGTRGRTPIWAGREARDGEPTLYVCRDQTCSPTHEVADALEWLGDSGENTEGESTRRS